MEAEASVVEAKPSAAVIATSRVEALPAVTREVDERPNEADAATGAVQPAPGPTSPVEARASGGAQSVDAVWTAVLTNLRPKSTVFSLVNKLRLTEVGDARVTLTGSPSIVSMQASYVPALAEAFASVLARSVTVQVMPGEAAPVAPVVRGGVPAGIGASGGGFAPATRGDMRPPAVATPGAAGAGFGSAGARPPSALEIQAAAHPLVQKAVALFAGRVSKTTLRSEPVATGQAPVAKTEPSAAEGAGGVMPPVYGPALTPEDMVDD
ncbi:MAG: hypothetical protein K2X32_13425 [Phycisphaerales bacterium]|nr:hypothetical protein [Phycisphaerales bacterium]